MIGLVMYESTGMCVLTLLLMACQPIWSYFIPQG